MDDLLLKKEEDGLTAKIMVILDQRSEVAERRRELVAGGGR